MMRAQNFSGRWICLGVLAILAMAAEGSGAEADPDPLARAREAIQSARPEEAVRILEEALRSDPGAIDLHELLGTAHLKSGQEEKAREVWEYILRAFPDRHQVRLWLAQLFEKQGNSEEAKSHYQNLLARKEPIGESISSLARLGLARIFLESGKLQEAKEAIAPLADVEPIADGILLEIRILREEGKLDAAIALIRRHLALIPDGKERLASLLQEHALEAHKGGDLDGAIGGLEEAAQLSLSPSIRKDLAYLLTLRGDRAGSMKVLQELLEMEGPVEKVVAPLGDQLVYTGKSREALDLARAALRKSPGARFATILELKSLAALGEEDEVLERIKELAPAHGADPEWAIPMLGALELLKRPRKAVEYWLDKVPSTPEEGIPILARLLRKTGHQCLREEQTARSLEFLEKALKLQPTDAGIQQDLGWTRLKAGDAEGALRAWTPLLQEEKAGPNISRESLKVFRDLGRYSEGIQYARRALRNYPEEKEIRELFWYLLEDTGRHRELVHLLDPEEVKLEPGDISVVAAIIDHHRTEKVFRDLLQRWRLKYPKDEILRKTEARILYEEARQARDEGNLGLCISLYRASLKLDPKLAAAHRGLAIALRTSENFSSAIEFFREATRLEPENQEGRAWLIRVLREQNRFEEARSVLEEVGDQDMKPQLSLEAARLAHTEGRLKEAEFHARSITRKDTSEETYRDVLEIRADILTEMGKLNQALKVLVELARPNPRDSRLLVRIYRTAVHGGHRDWVLRLLENLGERMKDAWEPYPLLIEDALLREDLERARKFLLRYLALRPDDILKWNILGHVENDRRDFAAAREAFRSAQTTSPLNPIAQIGLARAEMRLYRPEEALKIYNAILSRNPNHFYAQVDKIDALEMLGDLDGAFQEWERANQIIPGEIDLLLQRARLLSGMRRYKEAAGQVEEMLRRVDDGALPVLLYHSISPHFVGGSTPAVLFRDQMRALRDVGYMAVGLDEVVRWLRGEESLPPKAVLITFDDARSDNLTVADPILKEFDFRAVEFVITGVLTDNTGYYMSWRDLETLESTGRWEFGSHSHRAHQDILSDPTGNTGAFLVTRRWISQGNRRETQEEMERRIQEDTRLTIEAFQRRRFRKITAYSFPYGNFGQLEVTNDPRACDLNRQMIKEHFRIGFLQPRGVYNLRQKDRDAALLTRFSVPEDWDGERLLRHLRENHPRVKGLLNLARIHSWSGWYAQAQKELDEAAALGASEEMVRHVRAPALLWQGDYPEASASFRQVLDLEPDNRRALQSMETVGRTSRPAVSGGLEYWKDARDREILRQMVQVAFNPLPWLRTHAEVGHADYSEEGTDDIRSITGEVGAQAWLRGPWKIEGAFGWDWFDEADDDFHYSSAVKWNGWDFLYLDAYAVGGPVKTPSAVSEGIRLDSQSLRASVNFWPDDRIYLTYRHSFYSDDNRRDTFRLQYSHRLFVKPSIRIGYDGTYDNAKEDPPSYYGPDNLQTNLAFLHVEWNLAQRLWLEARAAGGYGWEMGEGHTVFQALVGTRWMPADWLELSGSWAYFRNPNYWGNFADFSLVLYF